MTREEFKTLVKGMKAVYAQPTFIPDQDAFKHGKEVENEKRILLIAALSS